MRDGSADRGGQGFGGGSRVILVVDDYPVIRSFVRDALEDEGYVVAEAADGAEALLLTPTLAPALILLDVTMPVLDGADFVAANRARPRPHAAIILMTAARDELRWLTEPGTIGHIRKPFGLSELLFLRQGEPRVSEWNDGHAGSIAA